jgi:hypothetical protein
MPRGDKDLGKKRGVRFTKENAREMGMRGNAARRANIPVRKCLKNIASEALYGHPPLPDSQLKAVADFFDIKVKDVTFAHLAIFKQSVEMAKGDAAALNLVAAYAGEKPTENISVTTRSFDALNEAYEALKDDGK